LETSAAGGAKIFAHPHRMAARRRRDGTAYRAPLIDMRSGDSGRRHRAVRPERKRFRLNRLAL
jgi:hypothetical protein